MCNSFIIDIGFNCSHLNSKVDVLFIYKDPLVIFLQLQLSSTTIYITFVFSSLYPSFFFLLFSPHLPKAMNKFKKSQVLILFVLLLFLAFLPLLPSSLKSTYLYFISNFIIIVLGAEAGLFSLFYKPLEDKMQSSLLKKPIIPSEAYSEKKEAPISYVSKHVEKRPRPVEMSASETERVVSFTKMDIVKKSTSKSCVFFIGSGEDDEGIMNDDIEVQDEIEGLNGQELYAKAEVFIRNFYKQLKLQKDES